MEIVVAQNEVKEKITLEKVINDDIFKKYWQLQLNCRTEIRRLFKKKLGKKSDSVIDRIFNQEGDQRSVSPLEEYYLTEVVQHYHDHQSGITPKLTYSEIQNL